MRLNWEKIAKAELHPLKVRILEELRKGGKCSSVQIARLISGVEEGKRPDNKLLGSVAYHMRVMAGEGLVEAAGIRPVRGAVEHYYELAEAARK